MPYAGGAIEMLIAMPDELDAFEQALDSTELQRIVSAIRNRPVIYAAPEWSFEQSIDAKTLLQPLGLPTGPLDFSAMLVDDTGNIEITSIVQKARIEVDKNGTRGGGGHSSVSWCHQCSC